MLDHDADVKHLSSEKLQQVQKFGNLQKFQEHQRFQELRQELHQQIASQVLPSYIYNYPPKSSYQAYHDWLSAAREWENVKGEITLYLHIPFCDMKCHFCDLFTVTKLHTESIIRRFVKCLLLEIAMMTKFLDRESIGVSAVYFGGGTPSLLSSQDTALILNTIRNYFKLKDNAEVSIEGAPNSLTKIKLQELKSLGFNRISFGIQSFQPEELIAMGRNYDAKLGFENAYLANHVLQFENVNIDLIYGLPNQTFQTNLDKAIEINPQTITLYPLVLRKRTLFGKQINKVNKINEENEIKDSRERYDWYDKTIRRLVEVGYQQKTLVTFVKGTGGCCYEEDSFLGAPTLSFGPGSRKYAAGLHYTDDNYIQRQTNKVTFLQYMEKIEQGILPVQSAVRLSLEEQMLRHLSETIGEETLYMSTKWFLTEPFNAFWEKGYRDLKVSCMGGPSFEVIEIAPFLPPHAKILDLGCGEGRNALYLASLGHAVTAVDQSKAGISKLKSHARRLNLVLEFSISDIREFPLVEKFESYHGTWCFVLFKE